MRDEQVTALEQSCSPTQLVAGLGYDSFTDESQYTTTCPSCRNRLYILDTGFLCENLQCDFRAGGILDFLKESEQLPDYKAAIDRLYAVLPGILKDEVFLQDDISRERVAQRLEARRNLFEFLRKIAVEYPDDIHAIRTREKLHLATRDDAAKHAPYMLIPLGRRHYEELTKLLKHLGIPNPPKFSEEEHPILLPYFTNHHTVGVLAYITRIEPEQSLSYIKLEPDKYQFLGLLQAHPRTKDFYLARDHSTALKQNGVLAQKDPTRMVLCCLRVSAESEPNWLPASATYILSEKNHWAHLITLGQHIPLKVATGTKVIDKIQPIEDYIADLLVELICDEGYTDTVKQLIDISHIVEAVLPKVRQELMSTGKFDELAQLKTLLRRKPLLTIGDETIFQTEDGYWYRNKGVDVQLTNFTFDFERVIRFTVSKEIYYDINLAFSDRVIPMMIAHDTLHRPKELEMVLKHFPDQTVDLQQVRNLPGVFEPVGRRINMLMRYFKQRISKLTKHEEGADHFGWTHEQKHRRYYGPNWLAKAEGTTYKHMVFSPGNETMKVFSSPEPAPRKVHTQLPVDVTNLIAQAMALVFRSYNNVPLMAVPVLRDGEGENFLRAMFAELGQESPLHYNENQWLRSVDAHGFPIYGVGCDYRKTQSVQQAVFMLTTDRGQRIDTAYSAEVFEQAGQTFRQVFHECVEWMLAGNDVSFESHRSVDPSCILAKEGARVIERAMGIEWHVHTPAYNVLDTLLSHIPFESTQEFMTVDLNNRTFELKLTGLPEVDATDLQLELSQYATGVMMTEHGVSANDADMSRLMTTYYQDKPKTEQLFVPPTDT